MGLHSSNVILQYARGCNLKSSLKNPRQFLFFLTHIFVDFFETREFFSEYILQIMLQFILRWAILDSRAVLTELKLEQVPI